MPINQHFVLIRGYVKMMHPLFFYNPKIFTDNPENILFLFISPVFLSLLTI